MMKHSEDDPLEALSMSHHPHGSGSSSHFTKRSFDQVGGSQVTPELRVFDLEKAQQLIEVFVQASHRAGIGLAPAGGQSPVGVGRFSPVGSMADSG